MYVAWQGTYNDLSKTLANREKIRRGRTNLLLCIGIGGLYGEMTLEKTNFTALEDLETCMVAGSL